MMKFPLDIMEFKMDMEMAMTCVWLKRSDVGWSGPDFESIDVQNMRKMSANMDVLSNWRG